ncbi:hypothetical protein DRO61_04100 [Candidatus Bathyarchaeota archaeon]|nr:hypothetical protein [Gammaproteobacteria bacterium]RLI50274.1 MAG: hypothetical protein DRO61_04100 [Candidatus Bathyarchaeota archaeon]
MPFKETILAIENEDLNIGQLVTILELTAEKLDILTISRMARKEGKSPNGIRKSNCYRKINIGGQKMAIKGLRDNNLPF